MSKKYLGLEIAYQLSTGVDMTKAAVTGKISCAKTTIQFVSCVVILSTVACTKAEFRLDPDSKLDTISKSSVFGDSGITPVGGDGQDNGKDPVGGDGQAIENSIGVMNVCSDKGYIATGGKTVLTSQEVKAVIRNRDRSNNSVVCTVDNVKSQILNMKKIDLSSCQLTQSKYYIDLIPSDSSMSLIYKSEENGVPIEKSRRSGVWKVSDNDRNSSDKIRALIDQNFEENDVNGGDNELCDDHQSPLVVNMTPAGREDRGLMLTSPEKGIDFDLLGENQSLAHQKVRISWPRNSYYMFLALPDANGDVRGINELFGNNPRGPDGKFAADGYAALAKHDLNGDQVIDARDAIYSKLALWSDRNRNGRTDRGELYSLVTAQIKSIDLKYDANFFEEDQYGNQSRMKSVVERNSGALNVIFDLWFIVK